MLHSIYILFLHFYISKYFCQSTKHTLSKNKATCFSQKQLAIIKSHLQELYSCSWGLMMANRFDPKHVASLKSVLFWNSTLHKIPEECRYYLHCGRSLNHACSLSCSIYVVVTNKYSLVFNTAMGMCHLKIYFSYSFSHLCLTFV